MLAKAELLTLAVVVNLPANSFSVTWSSISYNPFEDHVVFNISQLMALEEANIVQARSNPAFVSFWNGLRALYPSFMENSYCLSLYLDLNTSNLTDARLTAYLQEGNDVTLVLLKKYTLEYSSLFLLTLAKSDTYKQDHQYVMKSLDTIDGKQVLINGCKTAGVSLNYEPACISCLSGFTLKDVICLENIEGCLKMEDNVCLECQPGRELASDFLGCSSPYQSS